MVHVTLDGEKFVIDGGEFVEGPVGRANEIMEAAEAKRVASIHYVPDFDLYYGQFIEQELGGKITKWEPLPFDENAIY